MSLFVRVANQIGDNDLRKKSLENAIQKDGVFHGALDEITGSAYYLKVDSVETGLKVAASDELCTSAYVFEADNFDSSKKTILKSAEVADKLIAYEDMPNPEDKFDAVNHYLTHLVINNAHKSYTSFFIARSYAENNRIIINRNGKDITPTHEQFEKQEDMLDADQDNGTYEKLEAAINKNKPAYN